MTNLSKLVSQQCIFYWFILGSDLSRFTLWSYNGFLHGTSIPNPMITNPTIKTQRKNHKSPMCYPRPWSLVKWDNMTPCNQVLPLTNILLNPIGAQIPLSVSNLRREWDYKPAPSNPLVFVIICIWTLPKWLISVPYPTSPCATAFLDKLNNGTV
jgi:hypothetical protein